MADRFSKSFAVLDSPAQDGFNLAANSTNTFTQPTRSLWVGVTGNVCVQMLGYSNSNTVVTFPNVPVGFLPIRCSVVFANSTANGFVGVF